MKERFTSVAASVALWILVGFLLFHALVVFPGWEAIKKIILVIVAWTAGRFDTSDVIALITAGATFFAVLAAFRIAARDRKRLDEIDSERANLAAAGITERLQETLRIIGRINAAYGFLNINVSENKARLMALNEMADSMKDPWFRPDTELMLALAPLPNRCGYKIARAFDCVESVRQGLFALPRENGKLVVPEFRREGLLRSCNERLEQASHLIEIALGEFKRTTEIFAPMPTGDELYGTPDDSD